MATQDEVSVDRANEILEDEALEEEKLLEELENEELPGYIREKRMAELKQQVQDLHMLKDKQYGVYTEIEKEKNFLDMTLQEQKAIVHFYHPDFRRCSIIDEHLTKLAPKHFNTKFSKISVEVAKFFVQKLQVRILPAIICFKDGAIVDRIVGFEELGNTDSFTTEDLEKRIGRSGVIALPDQENKSSSVFGFTKKTEDSDSEEDLDDY